MSHPGEEKKEDHEGLSPETFFSKRLSNVLMGISAPISTSGLLNLEKDQAVSITNSQTQSVHTIQPAQANSSTDGYGSAATTKLLERQAEDLKDLVAEMPQASFGHGKQTKQDKSVRDALQLSGKDFEINISDQQLESILTQVKENLLLETDIVAELYSLNVYQKGGKFLKHKDTPRGDDMIGTLLICLPSLFCGGDLKVQMGDEDATYFVGGDTWSGERKGGLYRWWDNRYRKDDPLVLPWCAFFADVDHEIKPVSGGVRMTVAYLLRRKDAASASVHMPRAIKPDEQGSIIEEHLARALKDKTFLNDGGKIGFPCMHLYTNRDVFPRGKTSDDPLSAKQVKNLKGKDLMVANAALSCNLDVYLVPYLSHDCQADEGDMRLEKFPSKKKCPKYMDDDDVASHFGAKPCGRDRCADEEQPWNHANVWILGYGVSKQAKTSVGYTQNYNFEGYFGNEASEATFYVQSALHIQVPGVKEAGRLKMLG